MEFATSRVSSAPQDDYDDYDETTPPPPSLDSGYCSQSTSSSLELSQPDQPLTALAQPSTNQESVTTPAIDTVTMDTTPAIDTVTMDTTPAIDTVTPMDTTPADDDSNTGDSAIPALIPEDMSIEELHAKVMKMFPGFKPDGILRFSSLLGPGKKSSLPQVWKGVQKPKKRSGQRGELRLDIDWVPPPEMIMESDEVGGCVQCGVGVLYSMLKLLLIVLRQLM